MLNYANLGLWDQNTIFGKKTTINPFENFCPLFLRLGAHFVFDSWCLGKEFMATAGFEPTSSGFHHCSTIELSDLSTSFNVVGWLEGVNDKRIPSFSF